MFSFEKYIVFREVPSQQDLGFWISVLIKKKIKTKKTWKNSLAFILPKEKEEINNIYF